ncbi:hypothetical protein cyc_06821 [Cyclospora cayetanensis]|uniref:Derlin n=1 Tax=Cyclospora cayetanensis TaxID=88456 RepID=A0A1D3D8U7_9EIME|nr:hypothetical protein cyc_06821 [Cyclospora cayetanensis]
MFFTHVPPVTRVCLIASTVLMALCTLEIISPFSLYMNWQLVFTHGQAFSYIFGVSSYFFSGSMINVVTYIWGRRNPSTRLSIFFMPVQAPYLPFLLALLSLLVGWNMADHLVGIALYVQLQQAVVQYIETGKTEAPPAHRALHHEYWIVQRKMLPRWLGALLSLMSLNATTDLEENTSPPLLPAARFGSAAPAKGNVVTAPAKGNVFALPVVVLYSQTT